MLDNSEFSLKIKRLIIFLNLRRMMEHNNTIRVAKPDFSGKIWFAHIGRKGPNLPKKLLNDLKLYVW